MIPVRRFISMLLFGESSAQHLVDHLRQLAPLLVGELRGDHVVEAMQFLHGGEGLVEGFRQRMLLILAQVELFNENVEMLLRLCGMSVLGLAIVSMLNFGRVAVLGLRGGNPWLHSNH